jgi:hypothetical protein
LKPQTYYFIGERDTVEIPWQTFCSSCFAPDSNVTLSFPAVADLSQEAQNESNTILHARSSIMQIMAQTRHSTYLPKIPIPFVDGFGSSLLPSKAVFSQGAWLSKVRSKYKSNAPYYGDRCLVDESWSIHSFFFLKPMDTMTWLVPVMNKDGDDPTKSGRIVRASLLNK